MSILNKLASSLNRRDEVPNQELAGQIAATNDRNAVKELIENLSNRNKDIQSDCIKVLYEIGNYKPILISEFATEFLELLDSKNNRLRWGAMTALNSITSANPSPIFDALSKIIHVADTGTVITRDHAVCILIKLCFIKQYSKRAYAEMALPAINESNKAAFIKALHSRLDQIEKDTKRRRVEKVIKKLSANKKQ